MSIAIFVFFFFFPISLKCSTHLCASFVMFVRRRRRRTAHWIVGNKPEAWVVVTSRTNPEDGRGSFPNTHVGVSPQPSFTSSPLSFGPEFSTSYLLCSKSWFSPLLCPPPLPGNQCKILFFLNFSSKKKRSIFQQQQQHDKFGNFHETKVRKTNI